ncbi:MAG: LysM domain-containing protein [Lysobacterales bacterium]
MKRGDTLWDISGKFLKSPWYWPEIWQANPQIENPHLIYPGDVISLIYIDGKPQLVVNQEPATEPAPDVGPRVREEAAESAVPPLPYSAVREFLSKPRMLSKDEIEAAPYIVGNEENHILAADRQLTYVRRLPAEARTGDRFVIARPTLRYTDVPKGWLWGKDERQVKSKPWTLAEVWHWSFTNWIADDRGEVLGYEALEIGTATVSSNGDPATVYITTADIEIRKGDLLLPVEESPYELNFYPRPPKSVPDGTHVIAFTGGFDTAGPSDVVVLSKGAQDGLEAGEVYSIYQPGDTVTDDIAYPKGSFRALFNPRDKKVTLPEEFVGHVMVFRAFDRVSYGLVMNSVRPVNLGAVLHEPTDR